jgi:hypothetical protein
VKRVGKKQADTDQHMVETLDAADCLPEGKKVDVLFVEADGVFVRGIKRRKSIEVSQAIVYEGWSQNGKRVALKAPMVVIMWTLCQGHLKKDSHETSNKYCSL